MNKKKNARNGPQVHIECLRCVVFRFVFHMVVFCVCVRRSPRSSALRLLSDYRASAHAYSNPDCNLVGVCCVVCCVCVVCVRCVCRVNCHRREEHTHAFTHAAVAQTNGTHDIHTHTHTQKKLRKFIFNRHLLARYTHTRMVLQYSSPFVQ